MKEIPSQKLAFLLTLKGFAIMINDNNTKNEKINISVICNNMINYITLLFRISIPC